MNESRFVLQKGLASHPSIIGVAYLGKEHGSILPLSH